MPRISQKSSVANQSIRYNGSQNSHSHSFLLYREGGLFQFRIFSNNYKPALWAIYANAAVAKSPSISARSAHALIATRSALGVPRAISGLIGSSLSFQKPPSRRLFFCDFFQRKCAGIRLRNSCKTQPSLMLPITFRHELTIGGLPLDCSLHTPIPWFNSYPIHSNP